MNPSFEQSLVEVWRQVLIENAKVVVLGTELFPAQRTPKASFAAGGFRFRRGRDSWAGTESGNELQLGRSGAGWQEGDAVPQQAEKRKIQRFA